MSTSPYSITALRHSTWQFLTGKAISALLTFAILLWLVRLLPIEEYGAYVIMVAGMELVFALSGLGLPWLAARFLPEYHLYASGAVLAEMCRKLLIWQMLSLLFFVMLIATLLDSYLAWVGLERFHTSVQIYLVVLLVEGLGRFLREALLSPLMLQGEVRLSMVLRQLSFLALIAILDFIDHGALPWIICAELAASTLGMLIAVILLCRRLRGLQDQLIEPNWSVPALASQWHIVWRMYAAQLLTLTYSPQVFINLIQRTLGVEATALFGFLSSLQGQISRYLPATLLSSLIRPKLMASYVSGGGMAELSRNANLAGKLSLFALMPLLPLAALGGGAFVYWLSAGKFMDSDLLLLGLMLVLVPYSQRQLNDTVAVASGHSGLCTRAAISGLIMLPLMWVMLQLDLGLWAAVIAIGLGHFLHNIVVVVGVARYGYQSDWTGLAKLILSAFVAYGGSFLLRLVSPDTLISSWLLVVVQCTVVALIYLLCAWLVKPFTSSERNRINTIVKRRIFIW
jgi:O-antigen/teichoic acid export membrane protein